MRIWGLIAALMCFGGIANAAPIAIVNANFEDQTALDVSHSLGNYNNGAGSIPGWSTNWRNNAGVWAPNAEARATSFSNTGDFDIGHQVAYLNDETGLYQNTGALIKSGAQYTLSALFGNRARLDFGGVFGLYAETADGTITRLVESAIADPGVGLLGAQTLVLYAEMATQFAGQTLGIFFIGENGQVVIDNVLLDENVLVNPIPAAAWLFGTALAGGVFASRRKRKAAAKSSA
ncbi:MAG: hypothetical protein AAFW68_05465 [Pseudomonadota bacterium]